MPKRLLIRIYGAEQISLNEDVALTILRLEKEIEEKDRDFYDLLADLKERYKSTPNKVIEVIEVGKGGEATHRATISTIDNGTILFPEPVRLRAVYIARDMETHVRRSLSSFKRINLDSNAYIFQGRAILPNDVKMIILDTERGIKLLLGDPPNENHAGDEERLQL